MANTMNYATNFSNVLRQKYMQELKSNDLSTEGVIYTGANTIKIPWLTLAGYKDHGRNGGFNRQNVKNEFQTLTLKHDRNVEFFIDTMDVDETNQITTAANITSVFETEHAIPETDAYRFSQLHGEFVANGGVATATAISTSNILATFDKLMEDMDNGEVPMEGRILYLTPSVHTLLKQATGIDRTLNVQANNRVIDRMVTRLDDVTIKVVPPSRMKTVYDFADGFVSGVGAKQINMILVHPTSIIAVNKHNAIFLFAPGQHTQGDGYLYQNRQYWDLFVVKQRINGIAINAV